MTHSAGIAEHGSVGTGEAPVELTQIHGRVGSSGRERIRLGERRQVDGDDWHVTIEAEKDWFAVGIGSG